MSDDLAERVTRMEGKVASLDKDVGMAGVKLDHVSADTAAIRGDIKKLVWIIVGGLASAGLAWVLNGGLANV